MEIDRGRRLFSGELELPGRIEGHAFRLPARASRCANCHDLFDAPAPLAAAPSLVDGQPIGGSISQYRLTSARSRRGGPATRFDEASFCRLLRTGIDPAEVVVASTMPRYPIEVRDCQALWSFLTRQ